MREILFRGKCLGRLHKKGFVYGSLGVIDTDLVAIYQCKEFTEDVKFIVDIGTVGQYTGLTDKNGTKIFEGDIVNFKTINYHFKNCRIKYQSCYARYCAIDNKGYEYPMDKTFEYEVIGNIYDNPELLKNEVTE